MRIRIEGGALAVAAMDSEGAGGTLYTRGIDWAGGKIKIEVKCSVGIQVRMEYKVVLNAAGWLLLGASPVPGTSIWSRTGFVCCAGISREKMQTARLWSRTCLW